MSRLAIARAGLAIIDSDGVEALSFRRVAANLGVGAMTLYRYVRDREGLIDDIVALLLGEVDTERQPGEIWYETTARITTSVRGMALRHPRAFVLVAEAPLDRSAVLRHAQAVYRAHSGQGLDEDRFAIIWSVVDSFVTGFLLMEAQMTSQLADEEGSGAELRLEPLAAGMATVLTPEAFDRGLGIIIASLRRDLMGEQL